MNKKTGYMIGAISTLATGALMAAGYMMWKDGVTPQQSVQEDTFQSPAYTLHPNKVTYIPPEPLLPNRPEQRAISDEQQTYFDTRSTLHASWLSRFFDANERWMIETYDHNSYGQQSFWFRPESGVSMAQIEPSSVGTFQRHSFFVSNQLKLNDRHCEAGANIQERTAETLSQTDFNVVCSDFSFTSMPLAPFYKNYINNFDLITMSYILDPVRLEEGWRKTIYAERYGSPVQYTYRRVLLGDFWDRSNTIIVQGAGNEGHNSLDEIIRPDETNAIWNDTYIRVGAASITDATHITDPSTVYVTNYSSASAPTVIAYNPFEFGYLFEYWPKREDVLTQLRHELSVGFLDATNFNFCLDENNSTTALTPTTIENCVMDLYDTTTNRQIIGTSFTGPHLSGLIGDAQERIETEFGENILSSHDYFAATILAASPVYKVKENNVLQSIDYINNGSGLLYNFNLAGFGLVTSNNLYETARELAVKAEENPDSRTQIETLIQSHPNAWTVSENEEGFYEYKFNIDNENINIARMMFAFEFQRLETPDFVRGENLTTEELNLRELRRTSHSGMLWSTYPDQIDLISPDGVTIPISVSQENPAFPDSIAETNGFFGANAHGEWTIRVRAPHQIRSFETRTITYQKGGIIDQVLMEQNQTNLAENRDVNPINISSPNRLALNTAPR